MKIYYGFLELLPDRRIEFTMLYLSVAVFLYPFVFDSSSGDGALHKPQGILESNTLKATNVLPKVTETLY